MFFDSIAGATTNRNDVAVERSAVDGVPLPSARMKRQVKKILDGRSPYCGVEDVAGRAEMHQIVTAKLESYLRFQVGAFRGWPWLQMSIVAWVECPQRLVDLAWRTAAYDIFGRPACRAKASDMRVGHYTFGADDLDGIFLSRRSPTSNARHDGNLLSRSLQNMIEDDLDESADFLYDRAYLQRFADISEN